MSHGFWRRLTSIWMITLMNRMPDSGPQLVLQTHCTHTELQCGVNIKCPVFIIGGDTSHVYLSLLTDQFVPYLQ